MPYRPIIRKIIEAIINLMLSAQEEKKKDWKTKKDYLIDEVLGCLVFGFESSEKITELNVRTTGNSNTCFSFEGVSFHFLIVSQQSLCFNCWYNISFTVKWDNSERNKS